MAQTQALAPSSSTSSAATDRTTGRAPRHQPDPRLLQRLQLAFRWLSLSPRTAGAVAAHLFQSPRRHRRPDWEREILERGQRFEFVGNRGRLLPATSWGEGPTIALLHGWEGRGSQLASFAEPLAAAGFRVVAVDAPGHGDAPSGLANPAVFAETLLRLSHWTGGLHGVVAHSFGALGTAFAGLAGLEVSQVALVAPATSPRMAARTMADALGFGRPVLDELIARMEDRVGLSLDEVEEGRIFRHLDADLLVVHDRDDPEVSVDAPECIAEETGARVVWTQGLGHRRILRDPGVIRTVTRFFADGSVAQRDPWREFLHQDFDLGLLPDVLA